MIQKLTPFKHFSLSLFVLQPGILLLFWPSQDEGREREFHLTILLWLKKKTHSKHFFPFFVLQHVILLLFWLSQDEGNSTRHPYKAWRHCTVSVGKFTTGKLKTTSSIFSGLIGHSTATPQPQSLLHLLPRQPQARTSLRPARKPRKMGKDTQQQAAQQ